MREDEELLEDEAEGSEIPEEGEDEPDPTGDSVAYLLGAMLKQEFDEAERRRRPYERRWLEDLSQYLSEYDPETLSRLREDEKGRSEMFVPLTRKKVRTSDARLRDLLFPAGRRGQNWDIKAGDEPKLTPQDEDRLRMHLVQQMIGEQMGVPLDQVPAEEIRPEMLDQVPRDEIERARQELADQRAEAMRVRMSDQLAEMQWPQRSERVLHSGHVYGIGIFKGPIPDRRVQSQWSYSADVGGWIQDRVESNAPHAEFVPLWSWYPDLSATDAAECRYAWQEHLYPRHQVLALADLETFDGEAIRRYVRGNQQGDAEEKVHEQEIRALGKQETEAPDFKGMYRVLERWGWIGVDDLIECGATPPIDERTGEPQTEGDVFISVWMLGDQAIAVLYEPSYHDRLPYHLYYCEKLEGTILDAQGWPRILRNDQEMLNSSTRALLDNASATAGPQVVIDTAAADDGQTATIESWKTWYVNSARSPNATDPVAFKQVPNNTAQFGQIVQIAERWSHEHSLPSYMEGQSSPHAGGGADTARGLSMLMSAANIELKDLAKNFDHGVTEPFIRQLYNWNMEWSEEDHIKGDHKIHARGSTALMAKEVQAEQTRMFLQLMQPFSDWIKPEKVVQDIVEVTERSPDTVLTKEEHERKRREQPPAPEQVEMEIDKLKAQVEIEQARHEALKTRAETLDQFAQAVERVGGIEVLRVLADRMGVSLDDEREQQAAAAEGAEGAAGSPDRAGAQGVPPRAL